MRNTLYRWALSFACGSGWVTCAACSSSSSATPDLAGAGASAGLNAGASGAVTTPGASNAGAPSAAGGSSASAGATSAAGAASSASPGGATGTGGAAGSGSAGNGNATSGGGAAGSAGASAAAGASGAANLPTVSVYIAGDSTVSEYTLDPKDPKSWAGWGQMLSPNYTSQVKVLNKAVGGRTARRFIQEGSLAAILKLIQAGDYLLVQFGTNDSNTTAKYTLEGVEYPYLAAAETDFKTYLQQYIDGALGKQAIPVLVTPPPRNSAYCNGPRSLGSYGQAMLELGKANGVSVVDLGLETHAYLKAICPKPTTAAQETFFKINADDSIDGTHFQENGARIMAGFVADGVDEAKLGLSVYRKH